MVNAVTEGQVAGVRPGDVEIHLGVVSRGYRLAAASEMSTWAKAGMTIPPRETSWVVYLNVECGTRRVPPQDFLDRVRYQGRVGDERVTLSGCSSRATVPLPIRLVVVSCPATTSWKIVESISCSDSAPP